MSEQAPEVIRPDPVIMPDNAFFWEAAERGELVAQVCADCGAIRHPPRPMCPYCHSINREIIQLSGQGTVSSWIVPRHPHPHGFEASPIVALIELEEGIRLVSNLIDIDMDKVRNGMPVTVDFAPTQGGRAVPVFRPAR